MASLVGRSAAAAGHIVQVWRAPKKLVVPLTACDEPLQATANGRRGIRAEAKTPIRVEHIDRSQQRHGGLAQELIEAMAAAHERPAGLWHGEWHALPELFGLASGAFFALAAIGFRGAILSLDGGSPLIRASTTLVWGLGMQTAILLAWLGLFDRRALMASFAAWRPSLGAGFLGALASQFWFIGFALTTAANVRTLALVEVLMAQAVSHRFLAQATTKRELIGMLLILGGVALLLMAQR